MKSLKEKIVEKTKTWPLILFLLFLLLISINLSLFNLPVRGQEKQEKFLADKLIIYVNSPWCPLEALRKDIELAEVASDSLPANILIEIIEETKEDSSFFEIKFTGEKEFMGKNYHTRLVLPLNSAPDLIKQELIRTIKLGLVPYAARTPGGSRLKIKLAEEVKPTAVVDPWNFWVFSLSANSFLNGQKSYSSDSLFGNFSANRVTPEWKIRLSLSANYYRNSYDYEGTNLVSTSNGGNFRALVAKSLGEHWSLGAFVSLSSSTYENLKFAGSISPAIEYNIFPYSESTKRQLRITYSLDLGPSFYREETIFDRTKQLLVKGNLSATLELKKKWGTISTSLAGSNYFHDFSKYRIEFNNDLSIRLFRGFSVNLYGGYSRLHDLISIAKAGASWEDVLLMRKQLATSYSYYFSVGLSYSFGSIFSNVVNPRFGSGGGTSISISY
ncbi:MAG: hypothetical protein KBC18_03250 [Candidatus Saccharicenans sp.]|nr:hypothetical protein [Candidatus Saccharicenans sp.]